MTESVLPGVSIEVRPEGLIVPGRVTVGTIGAVGTASRGVADTPQIVGSFSEAQQRFGEYDEFATNAPNELTLVRALELAYQHGAQNVIAVRIGSGTMATADFLLSSASGDCCRLAANSPGTWGNDLEVNVSAADEPSVVSNEEHTGGGAISLNHTVIVESARNRIFVFRDATSQTSLLLPTYDSGVVPPAGSVDINTNTGALTFAAGEAPVAADSITATYVVSAANSAKVTLRNDTLEEVYTVASGSDLVADIVSGSTIATATPEANVTEVPSNFSAPDDFQLFGSGANQRGDNGAIGADYTAGLDQLSNEVTHIMLAAGQNHTDMGAALTAHCEAASSDANKRERVGVIGSALDETLDDVRGHNLDSSRMVLVSPGIIVNDRAAVRDENKTPTLSGAYAAAAVAGMMSGFSSQISLTNKPLSVNGLEVEYTNAQLSQLVQSRILALEAKFGFRSVKGITTSTNSAWHQITTRRIVDFAKFGVRSAANNYIGLLNNERVRSALRSTINSFLTTMVDDEKLISYELDVSATRAEEIRGIARVTLVLRPTFSIDFIKVTMFLE